MEKRMILFAAAALALAGCAKTEMAVTSGEDASPVVRQMTLSARAGEMTKTSSNASRAILWSDSDQIAVYPSVEGTASATPFSIASGVGSSSGTFTGDQVDCAETACAVYPYSTKYYGMDDGIITAGVPKNQTYVAGSIPNNAMVMASVFDPADGEMTFTPISAVIELNLYGTAKIEEIQIDEYSSATTLGGKNLSQAQFIKFENNVPTLMSTGGSGGSSTVILECPTAVSLGADAANATPFMVVVGGNATFDHLVVTITREGGATVTKTIRFAAGVSQLESGKVYSLPPLEINAATNVNLATWHCTNAATSSTQYAGWGKGSTIVTTSNSGKAFALDGDNAANSYIQYWNGSGTGYRVTLSGNRGFIAVNVDKDDFWLLRSTGVDLNAGDKIKLTAYLNYYRSACSLGYEVQYCFGDPADETLAAIEALPWTTIQSITFSATGGQAIDTENAVTVPTAMTNASINFRVKAVDSTAGSDNGQMEFKGGASSGADLTLNIIGI